MFARGLATLLALAALDRICYGEVVDQHFTKCKAFFYKNTPPDGFDGIAGSTHICQTLFNTVYYATHFSTIYRIPIYSAYRLDTLSCSPNQPSRRATWFNEPQLYRANFPKNMELAGTNTRLYQATQAINKDYPNTNFDKGHLNPNFYQCDNGRVATFTLTNSVPQDPCFNQQSWKQMEEAAKALMATSCNFPGAERYFVTGAVPSNVRIPNRWHDKEGDAQRDYERVSVPSGMWTAVCCDSSKATRQADRNKGFSFAYYGDNVPDSWVMPDTVTGLQSKLARTYHVQQVDIFADSCFESSENSKKAREYMAVPVERKAADTLNSLSKSSQSSMPPAKRRYVDTVDGVLHKTTSVTLQDWRVDDAMFGILAERDENQQIRSGLKNNGLCTMLIAPAAFSDISTNKRSKTAAKELRPMEVKTDNNDDDRETLEDAGSMASDNVDNRLIFKPENILDESEKAGNMSIELKSTPEDMAESSDTADPGLDSIHTDKYLIVPSTDVRLSANGDRCRSDHKCGYHNQKYSWCYTDWKNNWDYCCTGSCDFHGSTSYQYCTTGNKWAYCSQRSSMLTISGKGCRADHECATHGEKYFWCYTDTQQNWDYCCQPWHDCLNYGYNYKWCYTDYQKKSRSKSCYY